MQTKSKQQKIKIKNKKVNSEDTTVITGKENNMMEKPNRVQ